MSIWSHKLHQNCFIPDSFYPLLKNSWQVLMLNSRSLVSLLLTTADILVTLRALNSASHRIEGPSWAPPLFGKENFRSRLFPKACSQWKIISPAVWILVLPLLNFPFNQSSLVLNFHLNHVSKYLLLEN